VILLSVIGISVGMLELSNEGMSKMVEGTPGYRST
jgi:hypothetical protein